MPKLTNVDLTRRESQIMEILYRRRRATVEEIRAELPDAPSPSSVRKLLEIMIDWELLAREYDGPRYVYLRAKLEDASRSALKQLLRTFFNNSPGSAMAALLDISSTKFSDEEYRRLSSLLKRTREQGEERSPCLLATRPYSSLSRLVKATALLGIAAIMQIVLFRRASAATRHLVWTIAIVSVLLLPVVSLVGPAWTVEIPAAQRPVSVTPVATSADAPLDRERPGIARHRFRVDAGSAACRERSRGRLPSSLSIAPARLGCCWPLGAAMECPAVRASGDAGAGRGVDAAARRMRGRARPPSPRPAASEPPPLRSSGVRHASPLHRDPRYR